MSEEMIYFFSQDSRIKDCEVQSDLLLEDSLPLMTLVIPCTCGLLDLVMEVENTSPGYI